MFCDKMALNIIINDIINDEDINPNLVLNVVNAIEGPNLFEDNWERIIPVRNEGYYENVIPNYSLDDFHDHFRMSRATFQELINELQENRLIRDLIPYEKKLMFTLWILAKPESFLAAGDRFNMAKSTSHLIFFDIINAIANMRHRIILWPNEDRRIHISRNIQEKCGIPGVIGAIDGCHIPIKCPVNNAIDFYNRNNYHSVILQGVCDDKKMFTDIYVGSPGRMHDARVFRRSPLFNSLNNRINPILSAEEHLLGDAAYPLSINLLKPYRDNGHLTDRQTRFNVRMSSARSVIEQAFGLLKGKFRRLKYLDMARADMIPAIVTAACVIHNYIIMHEGEENYDIIEDNINVENDQVLDNNGVANDGILKRNNIAAMLH